MSSKPNLVDLLQDHLDGNYQTGCILTHVYALPCLYSEDPLDLSVPVQMIVEAECHRPSAMVFFTASDRAYGLVVSTADDIIMADRLCKGFDPICQIVPGSQGLIMLAVTGDDLPF